MTPQERQLLESLAARIANTQAPQIDSDADALIRQTIGTNPNALYILTQTVLVQEFALNQANARLHDLQQQQGTPHTSFLGRLFGGPALQNAPPPQFAPPYAAPGYAPNYAPPYPPPLGAGSSFLRSAAATATGVAAGALAFEGIESFLHHGSGMGGFGGYGEPSETVINNYYEDEQRSGGREGHQFLSDYDPSQDAGNSDLNRHGADDGSYTDSNDSGDDFSSSDV